MLTSCQLPTEESNVYRWVETVAVLPATLWLPKIDLKATIAEFCEEQNWDMYDASQMFNPLRGDALKADNALVLLSQRSMKKRDTLHLVCMTEYNVESLQVCDVLFQLRDLQQELSDAIVVGKYLLHAFCVFRGETVKLYDIKDATVVRSVLTQIENEAECMICLKEMHNESTVLPFACGHPICRDCFVENSTGQCAKCRSSTPWTSQHYIHLDPSIKDAARQNGSVRVSMRSRGHKARK